MGLSWAIVLTKDRLVIKPQSQIESFLSLVQISWITGSNRSTGESCSWWSATCPQGMCVWVYPSWLLFTWWQRCQETQLRWEYFSYTFLVWYLISILTVKVKIISGLRMAS
jgi:hypothetical protein